MSDSTKSPSGLILSVIIVSWNAKALLADCLQSLRRAECRFPLEVMIVDNASQDGLPEMVQRDFPEVRLIANTENLGFARANNQGMRLAQGRYFLLLNPDTVLIEPDALDRLLAFMETHLDVAAVGPQLKFPDGRHQIGDAGYAPTPASAMSHGLFLSYLMPALFKGIYLASPADTKTRDVRDVDWLCGAAFLLRKEVFRATGGFDEEIFMYAEDVEWGCRMRRRGLRVCYLPGVSIVHVGGGSEQLAAGAKISTRWIESLARLYLQHNQGRHWQAFRLSFLFGFLVRAVAFRLSSMLRRRALHLTRSRLMMAYARCVWLLSPQRLR